VANTLSRALGPGFFLSARRDAADTHNLGLSDHHRTTIPNLCEALSSKKSPSGDAVFMMGRVSGLRRVSAELAAQLVREIARRNGYAGRDLSGAVRQAKAEATQQSRLPG
jgi:hypothetical protein